MKAIAAAKGKQKALLAAAVLLVLAAAALLARQLLTVRIGDRRYPRAEIIDTRAALLSCEQYDAAAKESASAIRWLVPIGDERFDSFSEELVLSALPESEIDRLAYFPALRHVDAESCADYPALAAAAARFPAVAFSWHVPTADGAVDGNSTALAVKTLSCDELTALLPLLPRLETVDLAAAPLEEAEIDALTAAWPELRFRYPVDVWGTAVMSDASELTLGAGAAGDAAALKKALGRLHALQRLDLRGAELSPVELKALLPLCPADTSYDIFLFGRTFSADSEEFDLSGTPVSDTAGIEAAVSLMPKLKKVVMCGCGLSDEEMEALCAQYPDVDFIWLITFGGGRFTVRTDLVSFSTLRTHFGEEQHRFTDEELAPLFRYCRHLRALDLGHNYIRDITPIGELRELRILILGDNPYLEDFSPLGNLTELEYLELFNSHVDYDFSFLYKLHKIRYLNLSFFSALDDIAYIDGMPELKMFWLRGTGIPDETAATYAAQRPDVLFHYGNCGWVASATCHGWRKTETNILVRTLFRSWRDVAAINGLDDVRFDPDANVIFCKPLEA